MNWNLCSTYKVILIAKFNAKAMSVRKGRKIHIKTVRNVVIVIINLDNV